MADQCFWRWDCPHQQLHTTCHGIKLSRNGEWKESKAEIEILDNGNGAVATQGGHKVSFTPNLDANGGVDMQMPDGRHLRSQILGLGYYDRVSGQSEIIAVVRDADGELHGSNVVVYPDAFEGVDADVRFTYRISGFEQDVILRSQPPAPQKFGLNPTNTHLEVFTEFVNPPTPTKTVSAIPGTTLTDEKLNFGFMVMGRGRAFPMVNGQTRKQGVATGKLWITVDGRTVLVEGVEYSAVEKDLKALPEMPTTSSLNPKSRNSMLANGRKIPGRSIAKKMTKQKPMMLANAPQKKDGFVLDYISTVTSGTDFMFVAGETYLISDWLTFSGTTTIQGGAVLKFSQNGTLDIGGTLVCPSGLGNNACLTSTFDESYGDQIPSEDPAYSLTGPNLMLSLNSWSGTIMLKNLILRFGGIGVLSGGGSGIEAWHCQFDHFLYCGLSGDYVKLRNVLFNDIGYPDGDYAIEPYYSLDAQHVTVNKCRKVWGQMPETVALTNCLFTSSGNVSLDSDEYTQIKSQSVAVVPEPTACLYDCSVSDWYLMLNNPNYWGYYGAYLLTNSTYRNIGTPNIAPALLADIKKMTTYWPGRAPAYAPVDTGLPDLGFHYPTGATGKWATDTDGDGMVDAYEDVNQNGIYDSGDRSDWQTADTDGDGTDDLAELLGDTNPNDIQFVARFENLWVSNRTVSGYCEMQTGKPYQMKILTNSTDLSTGSWLAYNSNFSVTLPDLDTNYTVLVALRGMIATNPPVTDSTELTLDRVPPVLCITNPVLVSAASTVVKPYLQLQGYGNEPLASLYYNITNEFESLTNQQFFVTDQEFDTNRFDFTTNHFQAFDMALATNVNQITLRVSDRAGNVATTNITVTLDFSGDTTPPALALLWPTNGMQISGTNFYMRGKINDETATLTARLIDANDVTNDFTGIVERNGMFWVENMPLEAGTSSIQITATDAAGNVSSTNLSVVKSSVTLTINSTPTGDDLYQPTGTVSGTVSNPSYSVTVNGVAATVDSGGNWTAENVPNTGIGTATFNVSAVAASGGGGSPPANASKEVEMGPIIDVSGHSCGWRWDLKNVPLPLYYSWEKGYTSTLEPKSDGDWHRTYSGTVNTKERSDTTGEYSSSAEWSSENQNGNLNGLFEKSVPDISIDQWIGNEVKIVEHYFADPPKMHWYHNGKDGTEGDDYLEIAAKTSLKLYTGGKASISKQNLFRLSASGEEYLQPRRPRWLDTPWKHIERSKFKIMGKSPGSDGNVWIVLPDNAQQELNVTAQGVRHYRANWDCQKHKSYFKAFVEMPWPDSPFRWAVIAPGPTMAGHTWWKLENDAPQAAFEYLGYSQELTTNLNVEVGYFAKPEDYAWAAVKPVAGEMRRQGGASVWHVMYDAEIAFGGLISCLEYTKELFDEPDEYVLMPIYSRRGAHNCTTTTVDAASWAQEWLPRDWNPQDLGLDLKAMNRN